MRRLEFENNLRTVAGIAAAAVFAAGIWSCDSTFEGDPSANQPPSVWLSGAPPEGALESYVIKFYWGGWDPDGDIRYYEYCVTDNESGVFDPEDTVGTDKWRKVVRNDSTFSFTADRPKDNNPNTLVADFRRSHTFFIRAVDNQGLASINPAYRSFTARTLSPEVIVSVPRRAGLTPSEVPPITTFRWTAVDYINDMLSKQDPDSVSWILEPLSLHNNDWNETINWIRRLPTDSDKWGKWKWYKAPQDSGKFWTTPPKDKAPYVFAIRAKDEAGAITPVFDEAKNVRRVLVSSRTTGPILTVRNQYLGTVKTAVCNTPLTIMDLPSGIPLDFSWTADASSYGGTEAGYRYGWDITDLNDTSQWEIDFTPFPPRAAGEPARARTALPSRLFFFGTHVFTVEVQDNSGFCSRVEVKINIVQFTMEKDLLLVDDFPESEWAGWNHPLGKGTEPTDVEHDSFWRTALSNVSNFNETQDIIDVTGSTGLAVPLTKLAQYKSIVWSARGHRTQQSGFPVVYNLIKFRPKEGATTAGKQQPNLVALFMAAGGHLLYCGQHPMALSIDKTYVPVAMRYPCIFKYDLDQRVYRQDRAPTTAMVQNPPGNESFAYFEMCLEHVDYAVTSTLTRRPAGYHCPTNSARWVPDTPAGNAEYLRTRSMRAAEPLDLNFPRLELRPETASPGKAHDPAVKGLDAEVYNAQYFFDLCVSVQRPRDCFQPIYGLDCFATSEPTYMQPVAFWTTKFADVQAKAPGAVAARSAVFGFPPVMFDPASTQAALEYIFFVEWRLPKK